MLLRAEICQKKVHFLGNLKTLKSYSEINWPLIVGIPCSEVRVKITAYINFLSCSLVNDFLPVKVFSWYDYSFLKKLPS